MKIKLLFLLLTSIFAYNLKAFNVNGELLSALIKPGELLSFKPAQEADVVEIVLEPNNLKITYSKIDMKDKKNLEQFESMQQDLKRVQDSSDKTFRKTSSDNKLIIKEQNKEIKISEEYICGKQEIELNTLCSKLIINQSILKSPNIAFVSREFDLDCIFEDTRELVIIPYISFALIQGIVFKFKKNASLPKFINGKIDFFIDKTERPFVISEIEEIIIKFAPSAWNKN